MRPRNTKELQECCSRWQKRPAGEVGRNRLPQSFGKLVDWTSFHRVGVADREASAALAEESWDAGLVEDRFLAVVLRAGPLPVIAKCDPTAGVTLREQHAGSSRGGAGGGLKAVAAQSIKLKSSGSAVDKASSTKLRPAEMLASTESLSSGETSKLWQRCMCSRAHQPLSRQDGSKALSSCPAANHEPSNLPAKLY